MTLPNILTFVRIFLTPLIILLLLSGNNDAAAIVFLFAALSDWLDGFVARRLNQVSEFGKFLDPLTDKLIVLSTLIALLSLNLVGAWPVIIILFRELAITGLRIRMAEKGLNLASRFSGKVKMAIEALAIFMLIMRYPLAGLVFWIAVLAVVVSGIEYFVIYKDVWKS